MDISVRSLLTAGLATLGAGALAITPVQAPPETGPAPHVQLAAAYTPRPFVADTAAYTPRPFVADTAALGALSRIAPTRAVPAPPALPGTPSTPAPLGSGLGNAILNGWTAVLPWIDYGVNLADWAVSLIPFGYLIGDQISIVYYSLVRPVANSFVVDLVVPVVNNPLDLGAWVNGFADVGRATVVGLVNLGINEFNYFFGWLIPPIPPIGPLSATLETGPSLRSADGDGVASPDEPGVHGRLLDALRAATTPSGLWGIAGPVLDRIGASDTETEPEPLAEEVVGAIADTGTVPAQPDPQTFAAADPTNIPASVVATLTDVKNPVEPAADDSAPAAPPRARHGIVRGPGGIADAEADKAAAAVTGATRTAKDIRDGVRTAVGGIQKVADDIRRTVSQSRPQRANDQKPDDSTPDKPDNDKNGDE